MEIPTQRFYIIALIGFGAKLFDRSAISLRSLAIAMTLVVLLQPESVTMPGFQMSFAASAGLIALYEIWPRLGRIEQRGVLMRAGGWVVGAAATSLIATFVTMPFALHHFDRAALFSMGANIVSTPVVTLLTTPAAAAAALFAPFGLSEPLLWLIGLSHDVALLIAHYCADFSRDVDLSRLGAAGMGLPAIAIALFCVLHRRGRIFALIPVTAANAVWLSAPQAVGYVADDGSVFLERLSSWVELKDWRGKNGLNPMIIGDVIEKSTCSDNGAACALPFEAGQAEIIPVAEAPVGAACPINATLRLIGSNQSQLAIDPCESMGKGGAAIESQSGVLSLAPADNAINRPWAQRLYKSVPKAPKPPKAISTKP